MCSKKACIKHYVCTSHESQKPRRKQRGIKFVTLQSSGVFDPRSSRQMDDIQSYPLGSLPAGIKYYVGKITVIRSDFSSSVSAIIFPLWESTVAAAMDNPRPYPPVCEFLEVSVR